jgi:hypothetical protein
VPTIHALGKRRLDSVDSARGWSIRGDIGLRLFQGALHLRRTRNFARRADLFVAIRGLAFGVAGFNPAIIGVPTLSPSIKGNLRGVLVEVDAIVTKLLNNHARPVEDVRAPTLGLAAGIEFGAVVLALGSIASTLATSAPPRATAKVAEFLYRKATTDGPQCVTAAIFWMKTRGGWKETGPPEPVLQPRLIVGGKSSTDPTRIEKHELLPGPVIEHR